MGLTASLLVSCPSTLITLAGSFDTVWLAASPAWPAVAPVDTSTSDGAGVEGAWSTAVASSRAA